MALSLSRNATLILSYQASTATAWDGAGRNPAEANTFEIPILDGFSFSQSTGTQNVTLNEAGDNLQNVVKQCLIHRLNP